MRAAHADDSEESHPSANDPFSSKKLKGMRHDFERGSHRFTNLMSAGNALVLLRESG
jgi:hypothetical protein